MPSMEHESLLALFRNRPELAAELLRDVLRVELPSYREVRVASADLSEVAPVEYRADLVTVLVDRAPVLGIVLEVQLRRDQAKDFSWPAYLTQLRARYRCPVLLIVVAPKPSVARWCAQPIETGHPGFVLTPLVLSHDLVPVVADPAKARQSPELAVLSALTYGPGNDERALRVATAAFQATTHLPDALAMLYCDLILSSLSDATRETLKKIMTIQGYEFQSDFARKYYGKGRAEGQAKAVLTVLQARGLPLSKEQRDIILACQDPPQLERWLVKCATVSSTKELLASTGE